MSGYEEEMRIGDLEDALRTEQYKTDLLNKKLKYIEDYLKSKRVALKTWNRMMSHWEAENGVS